MKKFNFKETYLLEGFFDDLEDDLYDSDYVANSITTIYNNSLNYMDINCSNYEFIIKYQKHSFQTMLNL